MATPLRNIFGNVIKVVGQPRQIDRQYSGFPGAHGVTGMHLGSRGFQLVIAGTLGASGASYEIARTNLQTIIDAIEQYLFAPPADYSHDGTIYYYVIFDRFALLPDGQGKTFHLTSTGYVTCDYVMYARALI